MNTNQNPMTDQIPFGFAMPVLVPASASAQTAALCGTGLSGTGAAAIAPVHVVRERFVTGDADVAAIQMPYPGPTAWSPPTS